MSAKPVRVRYAPSPTGDFHVGGARTALFNYLFARHHGGTFIIRIEDTDQTRYIPEALGWLLNGFRYLGLAWDEGPEVGGDYGPYVQTERLDIYQQHTQQLIAAGFAYACFCTAERLEQLRQEQQAKKLPPGYDRHCRDILPEEAAVRIAGGEAYTVRVKMPLEGEIVVRDEIRGDISFDYKNLQDSVIMKSDGIPTYHLANVVDDHLMEISHILRGDEWVNSLPLHIFLYTSFGWEPPVMAHLPLILNPTGKGKMSKREDRAPDGRVMPVFVRRFEEMGYLPDAMVNYMALLGWSFDDKTEFMSRAELIERFDLDRVKPSPAAFDYNKLDHFNSTYIRALSVETLTDHLMPFLERAGIPADRETMLTITPLIQERLRVLSEAAEQVDFFFMDELPNYDPAELLPKKTAPETVRTILERAAAVLSDINFTHDAMDARLRAEAKDLGVKVGQMFQPIRVAVCGKKVAPPLLETLAVVGRDTTVARIQQAIAKLK